MKTHSSIWLAKTAASTLFSVLCLCSFGNLHAAPQYTIQSLGYLFDGPGASSLATSISSNGAYITGASMAADGTMRGFIWHNGTMTELPGIPAGVESLGTAVNNLGQVVGYFVDPNAIQRRGQLWSNGTVTPLYIPDSEGGSSAFYYETFPEAINDQGVVAGGYATFYGGRATVWMGGQAIELPYQAPYTDTEAGAYDINNAGLVVGRSYNDIAQRMLGTIWWYDTVAGQWQYDYVNGEPSHNPGTGFYSVSPNGTLSGWRDINDKGNRVGRLPTDVTSTDSFYSKADNRIYRLPELLPNASGWSFINIAIAESISEGDLIVGTAMYQGQMTAFLMTPVSDVPEPGTMLTFGLGLVLAGLAKFRRGKQD